jgi:4-amino-4-deoxy-L-arabinose transferase-like glycosyltransferase
MRRALDVLDRLPETRWPVTWLVLLCLLLWVPGFRSVPATDRDESRFAQASRQMVETGALLHARSGEAGRDTTPNGIPNGVPNGVPNGIHWAQAASVHALEALGIHREARARIWAYRVPSFLGGLAAVLATFHFGRALVGRRAAFLGAAMLAGCVAVTAETHIARADAALLGAVAVAMGLMGKAYVNPAGFTARQAAAFWLVLGVSALLKGAIGPLVPLLAAVSLAAADKVWANGAPWLRALRPGWGVALMALAALPWFLAPGRMLSGMGGNADEAPWAPPGYHLLAFGLTAFPAAFLVLRAIPGAWADRLQPSTRFLLAWAVPAWLLCEAMTTRLPNQILPAFPALMLLAAAWAMDPLRRAPPRWLHRLSAVALVGVAVGIGVVAALLPFLADGTISAIALAALPVAVSLSVLALRAGPPARAGLVAVLLAVPLNAVVLEGVLPRIAAPWISPRLAELVRQVQPGIDGDRFGVAGYHEPSLMFALGSGIHLLGSGEAAARFLAAAPGRIVAVADPQEAAFRTEAAARGLPVREFGVVAGFNYVRGRRVAIGVYGVDR